MKRIFLIMSLNNDVSSYHLTRHNVASWWIRYFCFLNKITLIKDSKLFVYYAKFIFNYDHFFILEPFTYINLAGSILNNFLLFYSINYYTILIIHDDLDLNVGDIRLKNSGSNATHNGVKNIASVLHTDDFFRLRIGIGACSNFLRQTYVLSEPSYNEKKKIFFAIKCSIFCVDDIFNLNFSRFRNNFLFLFNTGGCNV